MKNNWTKMLTIFLVALIGVNLTILPTTALATGAGTVDASSSTTDDGTVESFSTQISENIGLGVDAAMAIDSETGQILFDQNGATLHGIASLTKLISLFVVYDEIAAGNLTLDTKIPVSAEVAALSTTAGLSNVPLVESTDYYTVDNLIDAAIIGSGNAAVVAMAEYISGSELAFVEKMGEKLNALGIKDFELYTASGLAGAWLTTTDGSASPYTMDQENSMQARDILFVAREIVNQYPDVLERSNITSKTFNVTDTETVTLENTNLFLPGNTYERSDVSGLKTGTETLAGRCIIIMSQIDGHDVMLVTLGADSEAQRYEDTGNLLTALQENLAWTTLYGEGATWLNAEDTTIYQGAVEGVDLQYAKTNAMFLPVDYDLDSHLVSTYDAAFQYDAEGKLSLSAPLSVDESINTFNTTVDFDETLFNQLDLSNAIVPAENVEKVSIVVQVARIMEDLFSGWMSDLQGIMGGSN
ncbi:D-alanyl-D-alanine carboxypeptidase [Aerococcus agrisoli]|uniref:D-alanyl-D-alanine carboxypeptidase n=1 Tax=Aerococcus agrisoli TaxID=2487350 RepID=A0A3N4GEI8_9LACT|nr:serine hydrolase [Aerococcus agrisoli]RPA60625.1 D-alanyl-D-alanine carboxypeptidase [Aerococcus agrisoli]